MCLIADYGEVNKKTQNHSGSIHNMDNTLERIAKCELNTKRDKRSGYAVENHVCYVRHVSGSNATLTRGTQ